MFVVQNGDTEYPAWFEKTPDNCIVVVVNDSYTRRGRVLSLYNEANRALALQRHSIETKGDVGFETGTFNYQKDKFRIDFEFTDSIRLNYLDDVGYQLLDYQRYEDKFIIALFGPENADYDSKRTSMNEEPSWVNSNSTAQQYSVGFGADNYYFFSNYIEAFKHALFNLSQSNSTMAVNLSKLRRSRDEDEVVTNSSNKLNVLYVRAILSGLKVTNQWISPDEDVWYIRLEQTR